MNFFFNSETKLLRSGWRALAFLFVLSLPQWLISAMFKSAGSGGSAKSDAVFEVSIAMILVYAILVGWVLLISWASLRFMDRLNFRALGFALHSNWRREVMLGFGISVAMILAIVIVQAISGGTRIRLNPFWFKAEGIDYTALAIVSKDLLMSLMLLILAGAFEELVYRGYAFQTLLRGISPAVPVLFLSVFFALGHWNNPSRTVFSTTNTVLAGVWLAVAYLKARSLWFPTALHFGWNWTMGAVFGLPVSGLAIPQHPILNSTGEAPLWLTGGSYGPEGGAAVTGIVALSIIFIWRSPWFNVAAEMQSAWQESSPTDNVQISLNLQNDSK